MILFFGTYYKNDQEVLKQLRISLPKETIYGVDDTKTKFTNILLKPYEEEHIKEVFMKHKPRAVINYFERTVKSFDNFKYNVVPQKLINKYCPRNCKTILMSSMGVYDDGIVETINHPLNPKNEFFTSKIQAETVTRERSNHCIIRTGKETNENVCEEIVNIIDNDFRGTINV